MTTAAKATRPFYAVRVVLTHDCGSTTTRDYVRTTEPMSIDTFGQWAIGNLLSLASDGGPVEWTIESIEAHEVS